MIEKDNKFVGKGFRGGWWFIITIIAVTNHRWTMGQWLARYRSKWGFRFFIQIKNAFKFFTCSLTFSKLRPCKRAGRWHLTFPTREYFMCFIHFRRQSQCHGLSTRRLSHKYKTFFNWKLQNSKIWSWLKFSKRRQTVSIQCQNF